jgi:hypothetical protein
MPDNLVGIPGVSEDELGGAVASLVTSAPATELDDSDRFCVAVRSLVEIRAQGGWSGEGVEDVSAFVLVPYPRQVGEKLGAAPISNPVATNEPLMGRLLLLNRDASTGRVMSLPVAADALLEWLEDKGLGSCPLVMVYRKSSVIISRRSGAQGDSSSDLLRQGVASVNSDEVIKALDLSHRNLLVTPSACPPGVWEPKRSTEYVPGPQAEKTIQKQLQVVLTSWFHGAVKAEIEDTTTIGRIDIRLLRLNSLQRLEYWMIVELKIIKSCANAKVGKKPTGVSLSTNVEAICEGIRQSFAFAQNRNADAMLEVFDLRKDKKKDLLKEKDVCKEFSKCQPPPLCHVYLDLFFKNKQCLLKVLPTALLGRRSHRAASLGAYCT